MFAVRPPSRLVLLTLEDRTLPAPAFQTLPVVPSITGDIQANLRQVVQHGQELGNRSNVFAKAGDSITASASNFLNPLGEFGYNAVFSGLGIVRPDLVSVWQSYLAPVDGSGQNSYSRVSLSAVPGWTSQQLLGQVAAEISAIRPGLALVMIGTNDAVRRDVERFGQTLPQIVETYLDLGVVPVLSTIPDIRLGGSAFDDSVFTINQIIADVAEQYGVPLWNYWRATHGLPFDGIGDGLHPNTAPQGSGYFGAGGLAYGMNVRNLTALETLQKVQQSVFGSALPDDFAVPEPLSWKPLTSESRVVATGSPTGSAPMVRLSNPDTGAMLTQFLAYEPMFLGGVRVATADVNGDGVPDIVTAPGAGGGPVVKAFSGKDGSELFSFFAFEPSFKGGVSVAVGDSDGDGAAEIVVGAGQGGGPRVRVIRASDQVTLADFHAFEPEFRGGVTVALGNFGPGTGGAIVVGPGAGGGGFVRMFTGDGHELGTRFVFEEAYRGGVNVAAGDVTGDGIAELVGGAATDGTRVRVLNNHGGEMASFYAGGLDRLGVHVAVAPASKTTAARIVTGSANHVGAVATFDRFGQPVLRTVGSEESFLLAGPFVG